MNLNTTNQQTKVVASTINIIMTIKATTGITATTGIAAITAIKAITTAIGAKRKWRRLSAA